MVGPEGGSRASYEVVRLRALRLVDISLCGHVEVVVATVVIVVVVSTIFNCVRGDFFIPIGIEMST